MIREERPSGEERALMLLASSTRHLWVMDSAVDLIFGAAMASGGTSIQTWGSPDQIFQHSIRYNPIRNTVYKYKICIRT